MEYLGASQKSISSAEYQFQKIHLLDWTNKTDTEQFWSEVFQYKDASGCNPFKDITDCAISTLVLPHFNAHVKRQFVT